MFPRSIRRSYVLFFIMILSFGAMFAAVFHGMSTRVPGERMSSAQMDVFGAMFCLSVLSGVLLCLNHVFGKLLEHFRARKAFVALANQRHAALAMPRKIPLVGEMIFWESGVETRVTLELSDIRVGKTFREIPPPTPEDFKNPFQAMMRPRRQSPLPKSLGYYARDKIHGAIQTGFEDAFSIHLPCARVLPHARRKTSSAFASNCPKPSTILLIIITHCALGSGASTMKP